MAVDVNITGLSDTGTELGGFLSNMAPGLGTFLMTVAIIGAIVAIIMAIAAVVKSAVRNN